MNPDPPTSLHDIEVTKLLHLKSMAKRVPDGFATSSRIIRNPLPGIWNSLPQKRVAPTPAPKATKKTTKPKVHYKTESLD